MTSKAKFLPDVHAAKEESARRQIRGSSLLLFGRFIALGANFVSQLILVRYLTPADFGAWTYSLAVVAVLSNVAALGLDRTISRFAAIYLEKKEYEKLLGAILLMVGTVATVGFLLVAGFYAAPDQFSRLVNDTNAPVSLLFILIFLVPVDSLDVFLIGLFASFGRARAIFVRRYLLGPGLRLTAVLLLVWLGAGAAFLALGYLLASVAAVLIYTALLIRTLASRGLLRSERLLHVKIPAREILAFTFPLMTTDLVASLMSASGALMLGFFWSMEDVALYTVILPLAMLNLTVFRTFGVLYTPAVARLFAGDDVAGINHLYWRTAAWLAVLTFPIFAFTFALAQPLTVFLFGERYAASGLFLAILSLGEYFNVALGFNGLTLRVMGRVRYIFAIGLAAAAANILLNLLLIPNLGPLGAAISGCAGLVIHTVLKQRGLAQVARVQPWDSSLRGLYAATGAGAAVLLFAAMLVGNHPLVLVLLAGVTSAAVAVMARKALRVAETFPELKKFSVLRWILAQ